MIKIHHPHIWKRHNKNMILYNEYILIKTWRNKWGKQEKAHAHKRRETHWSHWCLESSTWGGAVGTEHGRWCLPAGIPETPLSSTLRTHSFWDQWSFWMEAEHQEMCLKLVYKVLTILAIWNYYENSDSQYCLVEMQHYVWINFT